jgi:tetratricopeptide (TPR) repeat protein
MDTNTPAENRNSVPRWFAPLVYLVLALGIRLLYYFSISDFILFNTPTGDSTDYFAFATQVLNGTILGRDILFHSSPIYSYFLAPLLALDFAPPAIALLQLLLGAMAAPLIVILARRLSGEAAGWIAGFIYIFMPSPVFYDGELLADFPLVIGMIGLVLLAARPKLAWWQAILAALMTFAVVLAKPNMALVALVLAIMRLWVDRKQKLAWTVRWAIPLVLCGGIVLATGSTFARNVIVKDEPVLFTTSGGVNFWIGNHAGANGAFSVPPEMADRLWQNAKKRAMREVGHPLDDAAVQNYYYGRGFEFIFGDPIGYLGNVLRRARIFANDYELPNHQDLNFFFGQSWILRILPLGWWLVLPLALAGMVTLRGRLMTLTNAALLSYVFSLVAVFFVTGRYRYPVIGLLIALAAAFLVWLWRNFRVLKPTVIALIAAVILLSGILVFIPLPPQVIVSYSYSYHHLGAVYAKKGELQKAIAAYEDAISYAPDDAFSVNNLGLIYMGMGKFDLAAQYMGQAAQLDPGNADMWANLGGALAGMGDLYRAEQALGRALSLDPGNAAALTNLAVVRLQQGDAATAAALCRRALERDPELKQAQELLKYIGQRYRQHI